MHFFIMSSWCYITWSLSYHTALNSLFQLSILLPQTFALIVALPRMFFTQKIPWLPPLLILCSKVTTSAYISPTISYKIVPPIHLPYSVLFFIGTYHCWKYTFIYKISVSAPKNVSSMRQEFCLFFFLTAVHMHIE